MILSENIQITITNQGKYWASLGYGTHKQGTTISVSVKDLPHNSNKKVECQCDDCGNKFERQLQLINRQEVHRCEDCNHKYIGKINGLADCARKRNKSLTGPNHPRWNPNKEPLIEYGRKVRVLSEKTYQDNILILNPNNLPRTLCGIDGGYQLDHKISIKSGFENNIPPEQLSSVDNLQLLPWKDNRKKWF